MLNSRSKMDNARVLNDSEIIFVEQYVHDVIGFSSQYGSDVSISYTAYNITGKPSKFPEYGDFPQAFVMRTYGRWWTETPSRLLPIMLQSVERYDSQDFIDIEFEEPVYPYCISIFETYNPGSVVKIWAADNNEIWKLLWEGDPQVVGHTPRIFSPSLKRVDFKTRLLRIEFHHLHLEYYTELDAVLLTGTKLPLNSSNRLSTFELLPTGKLTSQIRELNIHNIAPSVDIPNTIRNFFGEDFSRYLIHSDDYTVSTARSTNVVSARGFNHLPDETILKIFGYLNLISLCRCAQVNRHFRDLATDPLLYVELNLKIYWYCTSPATLEALKPRCQYLQKLDLSWCGSMHVIRSQHFINFICSCGQQLTHLRVNSCKFIDSRCMATVATTCKNLEELCLRNCSGISDYGFRTLTMLHELQYLDFYRTCIELGALQDVLKASPKLKHINVGSCIHVTNMDEVTATLASYNPELISADFWKTYSLTPAGVRALSHCKNLEEIDLGWCLGFGAPADSLLALAKGCPRLKKLFLAALRGVTDRDLEPFIQLCPLLEQIDLLGSRSISPDICESFLRESKHLRLLDISFCNQISDSQVALWRRQFPRICITRSFQRNSDSIPSINYGGVEQNPGPGSPCGDCLLAELRAGQEVILKRLEEQNTLLIELQSFKQRVGMLETRVIALETEKQYLSRKVDYLENQSRRNNLLIFGLADQQGESWSDCERLVREVAQQAGITLDDRDIERAHRVGRRRGKRPIVVKLLSYKKKDELLRAAAHCFRNSDIRVAEDFSAPVRQTRFKLGAYLQDARAKVYRASLRFDRLVVEGKHYTLADLEGKRGAPQGAPAAVANRKPPPPSATPAPPPPHPRTPPPPSTLAADAAIVSTAALPPKDASPVAPVRASPPVSYRPRVLSAPNGRQRSTSPLGRVTRGRPTGAWVPGGGGSVGGAASSAGKGSKTVATKVPPTLCQPPEPEKKKCNIQKNIVILKS